MIGRRKQERLWPGNGPKSRRRNERKKKRTNYIFSMAKQPLMGQAS
jgi:hypothetical protein